MDFDKKLISINVGPIDGGNRAGLGTSSLSGGERTYATAAFVIALWNLTELPFYYLDEFDVFMVRYPIHQGQQESFVRCQFNPNLQGRHIEPSCSPWTVTEQCFLLSSI